jgi:hypothetical protein
MMLCRKRQFGVRKNVDTPVFCFFGGCPHSYHFGRPPQPRRFGSGSFALGIPRAWQLTLRVSS